MRDTQRSECCINMCCFEFLLHILGQDKHLSIILECLIINMCGSGLCYVASVQNAVKCRETRSHDSHDSREVRS